MLFGEIGAVLFVLVIVFIVGNVWFHFIEAILKQLKLKLFRRKRPTAWHTLSPEAEEKENKI